MRADSRAMARRQLDKRLNLLRSSDSMAKPPRGWIKAIREALGMTTRQLGLRLGVSQPRVTKIEQGELDGSLTLETIRRTAEALDCEFHYVLVPRRPLAEMVERQARICARSMLETTSHSMVLEDQRVGDDTTQEQFETLVRELVDKSGPNLWTEA